MKKIPTVFRRHLSGRHLIYDEVVPGCEWVLAGEGVPIRKWDGTACLIRDGQLYKRYDAKNGRTPPPGFVPAQEPDPTTGHWPGWLPVGDGPEDRWHREGLSNMGDDYEAWLAADGISIDSFIRQHEGTYELCGPKILGNPERLSRHLLIPHGMHILESVPRTFDGLRDYLAAHDMEGIVFYHPDGRRAKIKGRDFGHERHLGL